MFIRLDANKGYRSRYLRFGRIAKRDVIKAFHIGHGTVITSAGQALGANVPDDEDDGALKPLPERLVMELTAHRTLALREAVGRSPDVALTLLLLKLVKDTFRTSSSAGSCLEASVRHVYMSAQASDLKDSVVAKLVDDRHAEWEADLPLGDDAALWDYLTSLDQRSRLSLLAHCLSFGVNALHEKVNPYGAGISASGLTKRMAQSDLVAQAVDLDMVEAGWEPTVDTYLNRVPKVRILEAVREAKGDGACFEGYWSHAKGAAARIRDYAPKDATLHGIADRLQAIQRRNFYQLAAEASHRGRYYHEYTMSIDVTRDSPRWQPPTEDAEELVTEALRDLARWLYRQLEAEYDHLTSDEAIEEGIIVNEYTFTEGGRRFG